MSAQYTCALPPAATLPPPTMRIGPPPPAHARCHNANLVRGGRGSQMVVRGQGW